MGDLLHGMTNLPWGESRTFKQRTLNSLSTSTAKELGIEMPPSPAGVFERELSNVKRGYAGKGVMRYVW
jgi:hypothetical protein